MSAQPLPSTHAANSEPDRGDAIRVMVVDDSLTVRTVFSRMVDADPALRVVATAGSAETALLELRKHEVDVILLDLEMPGMGGMEALPQLLGTASGTQVLVVSALTQDGAEHTLEALSMGAADTMLKPRPGGFDDTYRQTLLGKIRALGGAGDAEAAPKAAATRHVALRAQRRKVPRVVAFGASTGGIHALGCVLGALPADFDLPILVTQHLPANFMHVLARQLETISGRATHIADEGTWLRPGEIVIAGGYGHTIVRREADRFLTGVLRAPAPSGCMPSVDPMLSSLSLATEGHAMAVILSGMGRDGVIGAGELAEAGGTIIAQDEASSAVWGMPGAVVKAELATAVLPPAELADAIVSLAGTGSWK